MIDRRRLVRWYDWQAPFYRLWRNRYDDPLLSELERMLPSDAEGLLLDAACGTGFVSIGLGRRRPGWRIVGLDLSVGMLRVARRELRQPGRARPAFAAGDVLALPLREACVDVVVVAGLIPFIERPLEAIGEFARVLRPGGALISAEFDRETLDGRAGLIFRTMMAGHAVLSRIVPGIRYADQWNVERSTIDPTSYERTLRDAGLTIERRERAHRHLIYLARAPR